MCESKSVELSIELPSNLDWDEITEIEDGLSEAAGEVLKGHGLSRSSHTRHVVADYSQPRDGEES